jgi:hypothetical protein
MDSSPLLSLQASSEAAIPPAADAAQTATPAAAIVATTAITASLTAKELEEALRQEEAALVERRKALQLRKEQERAQAVASLESRLVQLHDTVASRDRERTTLLARIAAVRAANVDGDVQEVAAQAAAWEAERSSQLEAVSRQRSEIARLRAAREALERRQIARLLTLNGIAEEEERARSERAARVAAVLNRAQNLRVGGAAGTGAAQLSDADVATLVERVVAEGGEDGTSSSSDSAVATAKLAQELELLQKTAAAEARRSREAERRELNKQRAALTAAAAAHTAAAQADTNANTVKPPLTPEAMLAAAAAAVAAAPGRVAAAVAEAAALQAEADWAAANGFPTDSNGRNSNGSNDWAGLAARVQSVHSDSKLSSALEVLRADIAAASEAAVRTARAARADTALAAVSATAQALLDEVAAEVAADAHAAAAQLHAFVHSSVREAVVGASLRAALARRTELEAAGGTGAAGSVGAGKAPGTVVGMRTVPPGYKNLLAGAAKELIKNRQVRGV